MRVDCDDPVPVASQVCGARIASPREFRSVGADGKLELPLLPRDWCMGVRLCPGSSGEGADSAKSATCTPPALRGTSVRELTLFSACGHVGIPPTIYPFFANGLPKLRRGLQPVRNRGIPACSIGGNRRLGRFGPQIERCATGRCGLLPALHAGHARGHTGGVCPGIVQPAEVSWAGTLETFRLLGPPPFSCLPL